MSFTSFEFLSFFPIITGLFFLLGVRTRWLMLLVASYYFYASWKPWYLLLILLTTVVSYWVALKVAASHGTWKKRYLLIGVSFNLLILFIFKYFDFFNTETGDLLAGVGIKYSVPNLDLVLPVAISFYTFQVLSYLIDVYRGHTEAERSLGTFALYVVFYPQLVAGPIERSWHLMPQMRALRDPDKLGQFAFKHERAVSGLRLMLLGFFKKLVIADNLAPFVDSVYSDVSSATGGAIVIATYAFAFQILFDFSAYTDIARGAARVIGIDLIENFRRPYSATSITEFWRRWHISLSTWFRDYVYIPLGGNKGGEAKWARNILTVFVVSGAWHGANWTFIMWGGLHGLFYVVEHKVVSPLLRALGLAEGERARTPVWTTIKVLFVFNLVALAWVFFRAESIGDALLALRAVAANGFYSAVIPVYDLLGFPTDAYFGLNLAYYFKQLLVSPGGLYAVLGTCAVLIGEMALVRDILIDWAPRPWRWGLYYGAVACIFLFGQFGFQQFIYFQF